MQMNYAILVLSCDKYCDTWFPFFSSMTFFWGDNKSKTYLVTNHLEYKGNINNLSTIKTGDEISWSAKIRIALESIKEEYILVLLDDYFLIDRVNVGVIDDLYSSVKHFNVDYLSLVPSQKKSSFKNNISIISSKNLYGKTLQPAIWKKEYFRLCLFEDDFSAWEFENRQKYDSKQLVCGIDCCTNTRILSFVNGVLQGKWYPDSIKKLSNKGIRFDLHTRKLLPFNLVIKYKFRVFLAKIVPVIIAKKAKRILEKIGIKFVTKSH
jgi:hypothetical protein